MKLFLPILLFSMAFLQRCPGYEWVPMSKDREEAVYFPYERCVLKLNNDSYHQHATIFAQSSCLHHLSSDSLLSRISQRCWLGGKQQRQDDGICVGNIGGSIVKRGRKKNFCFSLSDRSSLWYEWAGLPKTKFSHAIDFINTIIDKRFELVTFVGDSMANQLGQRLLCAVLRSNLTLEEFGNFFSMPPTGASAKISNIPQERIDLPSNRVLYVNSYRLHNGLGSTLLHDRQSGAIPGVTKACTTADGMRNATCAQEFQAEYIYSKTVSGFHVGPKWAHTLHIFVLPIKLKFPWEYKPLTKALVEVAREMKKISSTLVVVSPFAQHFKSHPYGLYSNFSKPSFDERSCGPHKVTQQDHPESIIFKNEMEKLDINWKNDVHFFNIFPLSTPFYDLHSEGHSTGWSVDCTHFIFQPTMFDAIWVELSQFIRNL